MALSNSEKQQRWRERHIGRRRCVARIAAILLRRSWTDEHLKELGGELQFLMNGPAIAALRRALKPPTSEEMAAMQKADEDATRKLWLQEHPGRTAREYRRQMGDPNSEVWQWRRSKGQASNDAEAQAWEADHPGEKFPEHMCSLTGREHADYERWSRRWKHKRLKLP